MSSQRYERVSAHLLAVGPHADESSQIAEAADEDIPSSPPPSFRSRSSREWSRQDEDERDLEEAFDAPSDNEDEASERLMSGGERSRSQGDEEGDRRPPTQRRVTEVPTFVSTAPRAQANDGVWANLSAKPRPGDDLDEKPPTYEQAAADQAPPYWETAVFSPYSISGNPDDIFVDDKRVGSLFSFVWNALISMSFNFVGFLLTYLLHTTHAAKQGSRAGLGLTLIQYGFSLRPDGPSDSAGDPNSPTTFVPDNPDAHNFDPNAVSGNAPSGPVMGAMTSMANWLPWAMMVLGWFIVIKAMSDYVAARRREQLILSSPDRGLGVAIVAEGDSPETSV
ncbi:hypothetical protein K470DRAFT_254487 [Piedraia hortae CBS 480.64]|uniref:Metal homeostatis protein bsd2 n=1 Tax=Piedraia hortae CBS 480.64 TaxID=1314780 RepID=A0A6A7CA71_9PEZI|nr:hypothetical protein K470DRAFT_254487 [Piedraia hortae CBS 480.64]